MSKNHLGAISTSRQGDAGRSIARRAAAWLLSASCALPLSGWWTATPVAAGDSLVIQAVGETETTTERVTTRFVEVDDGAVQQASAAEPIQLNWRARHPDSFVIGGAKRDEAVRPAGGVSELNEANPFSDPFGDRTTSRFTSVRDAQDPPSRGFRELPPPPRDLAQPRPSFDNGDGVEGNEPLLQGRPFNLQNLKPDNCSSCPDKCYNDRDCCSELDRCTTAQEIIRQYGIKRISLNITPLFKPDAKDEAVRAAAQSEALFQAKSRQWRDRQGKVLAEGNLIDYRNNRVFVTTADGKTEKFSLDSLSDDDRCFVSAWWGIPYTCSLGDEVYKQRSFAPLTMTWTASQLCHKPLYFEEIALERYGHTTGPLTQPFISGAHFFVNIAVLPYKMGINPLNECQYDLGYYRPGNCAPWMISPIPLSPRGALYEGMAVTGLVYLIP